MNCSQFPKWPANLTLMVPYTCLNEHTHTKTHTHSHTLPRGVYNFVKFRTGRPSCD